MLLTIDEIKDMLIARYDPDDLLELLEPDIEDVVEGLHELICMQQEKLSNLLCEDF